MKELIPVAEIVTCESFEELLSTDDIEYVHYFVSSRIYFEHASYFRTNGRRCIVMVGGEMCINGVATLNVCQGEAALVRDLLKLQRMGHHSHQSSHEGMPPHAMLSTMNNNISPSEDGGEFLLSAREVEVAVLLCQGCINKEIADKLNISITTVITHRKNIMDKLRARSLADIVVYCVMNGIYLL